MYDLCVFTFINIFVFHTHVRMSYVLNSYLLTYLLTVNAGREHARVVYTGLKTQFNYNLSLYDIYMSEERPLKVLAGEILTRHCRQSCERVRTIMHSWTERTWTANVLMASREPASRERAGHTGSCHLWIRANFARKIAVRTLSTSIIDTTCFALARVCVTLDVILSYGIHTRACSVAFSRSWHKRHQSA